MIDRTQGARAWRGALARPKWLLAELAEPAESERADPSDTWPSGDLNSHSLIPDRVKVDLRVTPVAACGNGPTWPM